MSKPQLYATELRGAWVRITTNTTPGTYQPMVLILGAYADGDLLGANMQAAHRFTPEAITITLTPAAVAAAGQCSLEQVAAVTERLLAMYENVTPETGQPPASRC